MGKWWSKNDEYDLKDHKVYEEGSFVIYECTRGFIVHNRNKEFKNGHTHLRHFKAAKEAIKYVTNKRIPKDTGEYYLTSLARLSEDKDYVKKINELIWVRKKKGKY